MYLYLFYYNNVIPSGFFNEEFANKYVGWYAYFLYGYFISFFFFLFFFLTF